MGDDLEACVLGEMEALTSRLDGVSSVRVASHILVDRLDADLREQGQLWKVVQGTKLNVPRVACSRTEAWSWRQNQLALDLVHGGLRHT